MLPNLASVRARARVLLRSASCDGPELSRVSPGCPVPPGEPSPNTHACIQDDGSRQQTHSNKARWHACAWWVFLYLRSICPTDWIVVVVIVVIAESYVFVVYMFHICPRVVVCLSSSSPTPLLHHHHFFSCAFVLASFVPIEQIESQVTW